MSVATANAKFEDNEITLTEPKATKSSSSQFTLYVQDRTNDNATPTIIFDKLPCPFKPSVPKEKQNAIDETTRFNLELSVAQDNVKMLQLCDNFDALAKQGVEQSKQKLYFNKSAASIEEKFKPCLHMTKKQVLGEKADWPRLLRCKVHPTQTKFLKAVGFDANDKPIVEKGTMDDVQPYSQVIVYARPTVYSSSLAWGPSFFVSIMIIYPPPKHGLPSDEEALEMVSELASTQIDFKKDVDDSASRAIFKGATSADNEDGFAEEYDDHDDHDDVSNR